MCRSHKVSTSCSGNINTQQNDIEIWINRLRLLLFWVISIHLQGDPRIPVTTRGKPSVSIAGRGHPKIPLKFLERSWYSRKFENRTTSMTTRNHKNNQQPTLNTYLAKLCSSLCRSFGQKPVGSSSEEAKPGEYSSEIPCLYHFSFFRISFGAVLLL